MERHTPRRESLGDICLKLLNEFDADVGLVYENKGGNRVMLKKLPERARVVLHTVGRADYEYRVVEKRERALRLCRKIHVTGGVEQNKIRRVGRKTRLL